MRQGLGSAEDGILSIKTKLKQTTKTTPRGENSAGNLTGWAGKGRAGSGHSVTSDLCFHVFPVFLCPFFCFSCLL